MKDIPGLHLPLVHHLNTIVQVDPNVVNTDLDSYGKICVDMNSTVNISLAALTYQNYKMLEIKLLI